MKMFPAKHRKMRDKVAVRRRSGAIPFGWRAVNDGGKARGGSGSRRNFSEAEHWRLCLSARGIPFIISGRGAESRIFVPPLYENWARSELEALAEEKIRHGPVFTPSVFRNAHLSLFFFTLLIIWYGMQAGYWPISGLPSADRWLSTGCLWVEKICRDGELYRLVTALTLHSDLSHLLGNVVFGCPMLILLSRRMGFGAALFLTLMAGICGNACSCIRQPLFHRSIGFSTAVFGTVGLLCADTAVRDLLDGADRRSMLRRIFVPIAAGVALLAMLGAEGENVDYAAHIFGLLCGMFLGGAACRMMHRHGVPKPKAGMLLAACTLSIFITAWILAWQTV